MADTFSRGGTLVSCGPVAMELLADRLIAVIVLREADLVLAHCDSDFDRIAEVPARRAERWDAAA